MQAHSFPIMSSINECKWSKCLSKCILPLFLSRIFGIYVATFCKFSYLERLSKSLS